jgi:transposase
MTKVKRPRRNHTREFKAETVKLVREGGRSIGQVARDLGLADSLLRNWMRQSAIDEGTGPAGALTTAEKEELSQLRREVRVLRMEREILKNYPRGFSHLLDEKRSQRYGKRGPGGAAVRSLETTTIPIKNMVQGLQRTWHW